MDALDPLGAAGRPSGTDGDDAKIRAQAEKAAVKFEAYMVTQMLHRMRSSLRELADDDSPLKNKLNDDMLDLADGLMADQLAGQHAFGIADALLRQLLPPATTTSPAAPAESTRGAPVAAGVNDRTPEPPAAF